MRSTTFALALGLPSLGAFALQANSCRPSSASTQSADASSSASAAQTAAPPKRLRSLENIASNPSISLAPKASGGEIDSQAILAFDGNSETAWRGNKGTGPWDISVAFKHIVHLGLIRAFFGDSASRGVPSRLRWDFLFPSHRKDCSDATEWRALRDGLFDDRDPNEFAHGPRIIHAQRQSLFADTHACGVRLLMEASDDSLGPVVREIRILESAASVSRLGQAEIRGDTGTPALRNSTLNQVIDGAYETYWAGEREHGPWELIVELKEPKDIDRLGLLVGYDAVTVPRETSTGRSFSGSFLPLDYSIELSPDSTAEHFQACEECAPRISDNSAIPVRRRLIHFRQPRRVKQARIRITKATGFNGENDPRLTAPVIRQLDLYESTDSRPVITEPLFLSVNANPSGLTHEEKGAEAASDGNFARDAYHRLQRIILGFQMDSRWPADASRKRNDNTGRFLEAIEADDPLLDSPLLEANSPPPILILSGSLDWEFANTTQKHPTRKPHWSWNVLSKAGSPGRGMGQLQNAIRTRSAPMIGFCGGAQILALLSGSNDDPSDNQALVDSRLMRNSNQPIRGLISTPDPYERLWWNDPPKAQARRPEIFFLPNDPVFDTLATARQSSLELPSSHGDSIRSSAFDGALSDFAITAWSSFCRTWVKPDGLEASYPHPSQQAAHCIKVPQAFRSKDQSRFPILGFQFHPEQRDIQQLDQRSPPDARGDALNVVANAVSLIFDSYEQVFWPTN